MAQDAKTAGETTAALGTPYALARVAPESEAMLIGRWRHGDARVTTSRTDAFRLLLSLSSTQRVRYQDPDHDAIMDARAGDVGVLPASVESMTTIDGNADILQVFIDPAAVAPFADREQLRREIVGGQSEALRRDMVRFFVFRTLSDRSRQAQSASALRRTVARLLREDASAADRIVSGGLTPTVFRRVNRLMREVRAGGRPPTICELADEAGLSRYHFIRAYRTTVGRTPYQQQLARRHQQALGLLPDRSQSIADIADLLGFSSHAHFTASFRRSFGVTPSAYRLALAAAF